MTREEFVARWSARREEWQRFGACVDGSVVCTEVLVDFEAFLRTCDDAWLTLEEAADACGYSGRHLRRLASAGELDSTRRGRRVLLRAGSLPRKPAAVNAPLRVTYDAVADARRVLDRR